MVRKIIFFELNEVPGRVVEDFVSGNPDSHLAKLLPSMKRYETYSDDRELSPWVTWPTVHRGVSDDRHSISDFSQDLREINRAYPSIWEILAKQGVKTGVCGSFHSYPLVENLEDYAFYIPDVFAAGSECFPASVTAFQDFNLAMSRSSGRNAMQTKMPWNKALRFLAAAPALGLKPQTMVDVGSHVVGERRRRWTKVRRRTYQVVLAFDIFMKQLRQTKPSFATFFTNHVASSMHRFWAARYPEDYAEYDLTDEWANTYRSEIDWTMSKFDQMLGRIAKFIERNSDYDLWIASSMGQAATTAEEIRTQLYLDNVETFMKYLGFDAADYQQLPAMLPRIILSITKHRLQEFHQKLDAIELPEVGSLRWTDLEHGVIRIHPGEARDLRVETCRFEGRVVPLSSLGFANLPLEDTVGQTAYHIPQGTLFLFSPNKAETDGSRVTSVPTVEIAPSILNRFGVAVPSYMPKGTIA